MTLVSILDFLAVVGATPAIFLLASHIILVILFRSKCVNSVILVTSWFTFKKAFLCSWVHFHTASFFKIDVNGARLLANSVDCPQE